MTKEYNRRGAGAAIKHPSVRFREALAEALGERKPSPFVAVGLVFIAPGADK